jgi:hypothetical protein
MGGNRHGLTCSDAPMPQAVLLPGNWHSKLACRHASVDILAQNRCQNIERLTQCPQYGQTLLSSSRERPHSLHFLVESPLAPAWTSFSSLPQSPQNFFPSGLSAPQLAHFIVGSPLGITLHALMPSLAPVEPVSVACQHPTSVTGARSNRKGSYTPEPGSRGRGSGQAHRIEDR